MKIRLWRTRSDDATPDPEVRGADWSLYGSSKPEPYLLKAARSRRFRRALAPSRRQRRRRAVRRWLTASGSAGRVALIRLLELGSMLTLLRGLWLVWVPLAWIAGAVLLLGLSMILDNEG